jgi:hypothetical protein
MKTKQSLYSFSNSFSRGDFRPRIRSCGINGKTGWIEVEQNGVTCSGQVAVALVKRLKKMI